MKWMNEELGESDFWKWHNEIWYSEDITLMDFQGSYKNSWALNWSTAPAWGVSNRDTRNFLHCSCECDTGFWV